jgi:2-desacetyl-2-hydroxyethyl bacteriochlorophyllide A dehydrogenase
LYKKQIDLSPSGPFFIHNIQTRQRGKGAGMRALLCLKPGELDIVERPRPSPKAGEVLVRIRRAGICGTDLHIYEGSHPFLDYPRVIGHELSGEIAEVGPGCAVAVGQQVYVIPYLSCGTCVACRRGKTNCCQRIGVLGVHVDGGLAEYICVPEHNVVAADGVTLDQAAMIEFLAIGAHALRRANPVEGDRILVVGAGPIGIGCMIFAKLRGGLVTALDRRDDRLAFCRDRLGVNHTVVAGSNAHDALFELTDGDFFDIVIDATGNAGAMMAGFDYVAHGGAYVFVSIVRDTISFADPEFHKRETSLLGSRNATPEDFFQVFQAMRDGFVPTDALVTHRAPLAEAPGRFPVWIKPETGVIKALIEL